MKKWIVFILSLALVLLASAYLFTSPVTSFSQAVRFRQSPAAVIRAMYNLSTWQKWWPGERITDNHFRYDGYNYRITDKGISTLVVMVSDGKDSVRTTIDFIASGIDSIEIIWQGSTRPVTSPAGRVTRLFKKDGMSREIAGLVKKLEEYYSRDENLYGMKFTGSTVSDTALVSTSEVRTTIPGTSEIYGMLDRLENHIKKNGAEKTGNPMLNISEDKDSVLVRVAIPVNKRIPDSGNISYRWMLPGGLIMIAEYKGGPYGAMKAVKIAEEYLRDHDLKQPAIPYQSLVTNRLAEPDTSKWVTRIYCPYY